MEQDKIDEAWKFLEDDKSKFELMVKKQAGDADAKEKEIHTAQEEKKTISRKIE